MAFIIQGYTFLYQYLNSWLHFVPMNKKNPNALKVGVMFSDTINAASSEYLISILVKCVI